MPPEPTVALILAGGEARRMGGGDKPLLELGGQSMLARVIAALQPLPIAISANGDPARFGDHGCTILPDGPFAGEGPLAGLLAGLDWAAGRGATALLSVPGDTPFVPSGLVRALEPEPSWAAYDGRVHPLVALWPVGCRAALRAWLNGPNTRAVMQFGATIGVRSVEFPVQSFDPFLNVNTPEALKLARLRAAMLRPGEENAG